MSQSDNQSATHVGLLHGQDTEDGNFVRSVVREKIIENETEKKKKKKKKKKGVSKCTVLKSDPPALRTGNDKFRISFSHVQRSLSNRKPAEREREKINKIKPLGLYSVGLTAYKMCNFKSATAAKVQRGRYYNRLRVS